MPSLGFFYVKKIVISYFPEGYLQPFQTSMMKFFVKITLSRFLTAIWLPQDQLWAIIKGQSH